MARVAVIAAVLAFSVFVFVSRPTTPGVLLRELPSAPDAAGGVSAPDSVLAGEVFDLEIALPGSGVVRVHLLRYGRMDGLLSYSWAAFRPVSGIVRTSSTPSVGGTYWGVDRAGLLWSARPLLGDQSAVWARLRRLPQLPARGYVVLVEQEGKVVAVRTLRMLQASDVGIRIEKVTVPFPGYLVRPRASGDTPVVLLLGGSGDSVLLAGAVKLAASGVTVFAARYLSTFGASRCFDNVEISRFDDLARWLLGRLGRPDAGMRVVGVSAGAEAALLIAAQRYEWLTGFVAVVPSRWHFNGATGPLCAFPAAPWSIDGKGVPYLLNFPLSLSGVLRAGAVRAGWLDQRATIDDVIAEADPEGLRGYELDVSTIAVPGLLFGAEADEHFPSGESVRQLCAIASMSAAGVRCRTFPDASHSILALPGRRNGCADWGDIAPRDAKSVQCHATLKAAQTVWDETIRFVRAGHPR